MRTGVTLIRQIDETHIEITEIDIKKIWVFIHAKFPGLNPNEFLTTRIEEIEKF